MAFTHLHVHTEHSFLDGVPTLSDLCDRVLEIGQNSIAITDHGECSGHLQFQEVAKNRGVKPIFGMEGYFVDDVNVTREAAVKYDYEHITLLAQNEVGLRNLWTLSSRAFIEGFYYKPLIDWNLLSQHSEGIIATGGCMNGCVSAFLAKGEKKDDKFNPTKAEERLSRFYEILGDNFYFELHTFPNDRQRDLNQRLMAYSSSFGIPLVAVSDSHYLRPEDWKDHEMLIAAQMGKKMDDPDRYTYGEGALAVIDEAEVRTRLINHLPEDIVEKAINNTQKIADSCDVEIKRERSFPVFFKEAHDDVSYLKTRAEEKFDERIGPLALDSEAKQQYRDRLHSELELIIEKGYAGYFLIVADLINWAKDNGILIGPGRGSAGGSLLSYVLGITEIDPISANLMFERFLEPGRNSLPDIDIDVPQIERSEVREYLTTKYDVATIGTLNTLAPRILLRDFARLLEISIPEVNAMSGVIAGTKDLTVLDKTWLQVKDEMIDQLHPYIVKYPQLFKLMDAFASHYRHAGAHAAGLVVSREPLMGNLPLRKKDEDIRTQMPMEDVEELGYVKIDLLGLRTLSTLMRAYAIAKEKNPDGDCKGNPWGDKATDWFYSWQYDWANYYDDQDVFEALWNGRAKGIFQIEGSDAMAKLVRDYKPQSIEDMCTVVSLFRPGITRAIDPETGLNMMEIFVRKRQGKMPVKYKHELLEPILKDTYGAFLYQEQVMKTVAVLANYTPEEQDKIRKIMGKTKPEEMKKQKEIFLKRSKIGPDESEVIWNEMEKFGIYAFNRAHGWAYGMIAYWTAFMKHHYPAEYMTALFQTNEGDSKDYVRESRRLEIPILGPDINESQSDFALIDGHIRYGLHAVKYVSAAAEIIQSLRPFTSMMDFMKKINTTRVNKRVIESLALVGALESIVVESDREHLPADWSNTKVALYLAFRHKKKLGKKASAMDELQLFDKFREEFDEYVAELDVDNRERYEVELLGEQVTTEPFSRWLELIQRVQTYPGFEEMFSSESALIGGVITEIKHMKTKKGQNPGQPMCQFWLEYPVIEEGKVADIQTQQIVSFPGTFAEFKKKIEINAPVVARVSKLRGDGGLALDKLYRMDQDL